MDIGIDKIGDNAGKIWETLNANGSMSVAQVKKKTTLSDPETNMAIGWLAREEKVSFTKKGKSINIALV